MNTDAKIRDRIVDFRRVKAADLVHDERNWRTHPDNQRKALEGVLAEIGIADVLLVRELNGGKLGIIDGHLRSDILADQEIPVVVLDLDDDESGKLLATLDPLAALAGTNKDKLESLLSDIETQSDDLAKMLEGLAEDNGLDLFKLDEPEDVEPQIDRAAELQEQWGTESGQLWLIEGKQQHRLLCGNSTKQDDVTRLLDSDVPFIMVTDPPYGVNYDPSWRNERAEAGHLSYADRRVGQVINDDRVDWSDAYLLFPGDVAYTWSPGDHVIQTGQAIQTAGFQIRNQIIWRKSHIPISRGHYAYRHEPCWYGVRPNKKSYWCGETMATTVWDISLDENIAGGHGTQKPLECMARPIRNHGKPGDGVYDPFLGSGTTMLAAEQLGRRCYGMEISPAYCAVILQRMTDAGCKCKLAD